MSCGRLAGLSCMSIYPDMSVQQRAEQPYVGMTASVTMDDFSSQSPTGCLRSSGDSPSGASSPRAPRSFATG
jgi:hypothetical protein